MENKDTGAHVTHSRRHYTPTRHTVIQTQAILSYSFKILVSSILEQCYNRSQCQKKIEILKEKPSFTIFFLLYRCKYNNNKSKNNAKKTHHLSSAHYLLVTSQGLVHLIFLSFVWHENCDYPQSCKRVWNTLKNAHREAGWEFKPGQSDSKATSSPVTSSRLWDLPHHHTLISLSTKCRQ